MPYDKLFNDVLAGDELNDEQLYRLYWLSLIDATSAEQSNVSINFDERTRTIKRELSRTHKFSKVKQNLEEFIQGFFYSGRATHMIIARKLTNAGLGALSEVSVNGCPPVDVYAKSRKLAIEVKRMYSSAGIYDGIEGTVEKYKNHKSNNIVRIMVLFVHPLEVGQNYFEWATDGYKSLFQALKDEKAIPKNFDFHIESFDESTNKLDRFIKTLIERINRLD